ncbi:MAG: hypothetical protein Q8T09_06665 [Candidatus Melainabacteria bacterium]|nr:hypothetical protein [Candidatus Melainabacteria bacterium]
MTSYHKSTSIWLVVNTLILALASSYVLEFTAIGCEISNQSDRLDVIDKIDQFPKDTPNTVLILGSSLGIFPAALADFKEFGAPKPGADKFLHYSSYRYLDKLLSADNGSPVKTLNLSNQGGMTSEDLLLLKGAFKAGINPKLVILLTGPRDFLDHQTNKIGESKLSKALLVRISDSLWNFSETPTTNLETLASRFLPLFLQRDAVTKFLTTGLKKTIAFVWNKPYRDKPVATGGSLESIKDEPGSPEMMDFYTANYKIRYLPIDWQRWKLECVALGQIIEYCDNKKIPLLVVAMPLSKINRDLLPKDFVCQHRNMLKNSARKHLGRIILLDLFESDHFKIADYMDTVHLRSCGGIKLAREVTQAIKASSIFQRKYN